jgi:O-antigen/teichoic acid export membrane protein
MEQDQANVTFGRQVGYVIVLHIVTLVVGLLQIPILTKGLGAELYGTWSLIIVTVSLTVPFVMLGFNMSIVRFLAAEKNEDIVKDDFFSAFSMVFILGTILSILLFFLSDYLAASIFKGANSAFYIKIASALILVNAIDGLPLAFLRMRRKIGLYAIIRIAYNILRLALIVALIQLGYGLTGAIVAIMVSGASFTLINMLIILRQIGFKLPSFSHMKSYLKYGLPLMPNQAILWIINSSDRYMVSHFLGAAATGIYSAAYQIGDYACFILMPIGVVLYPTIAKSYDEGKLSETRKYLKYSVKYVMMIAIPSAAGLSILAKPLLGILTTQEFVVGNTLVPLIAFGAVLVGFFQICIYVIHLVKKTQWSLRLLLTSATLNIVLNLVLIPRMGMMGAAVATLVAYGVLGMLTLVITRRYLKFSLSLPFILKSTFASAIMVLCIWPMKPDSIPMVIVAILVGVLVYFAVFLAFKGLNKREISFFIDLAKENFRKIGIMKR